MSPRPGRCMTTTILSTISSSLIFFKNSAVRDRSMTSSVFSCSLHHCRQRSHTSLRRKKLPSPANNPYIKSEKSRCSSSVIMLDSTLGIFSLLISRCGVSIFFSRICTTSKQNAQVSIPVSAHNTPDRDGFSVFQLQVSVYYCRKEKNNKSENFNSACIFAAKANIDLMLKYRIDKPGHNVLLLLVTLLHP